MFDPYSEWLKISPDRRPPTHYELLGLSPRESDAAVIHKAVMERMALVRRYQLGEHADVVAALLNELSAAFNCLSDAGRRQAYDEQLRTADTLPIPIAPTSKVLGASTPDAPAKPGRKTRRPRTSSQAWRFAAVAAIVAVGAIIWLSQQPGKRELQQSDFVAGGAKPGAGNEPASTDGKRAMAPVEPASASGGSKPSGDEDRGDASTIRYFGYATGGPNPVLREIAPYTNIVFVWNWINQPTGILMAAEEAKLPQVLCVNGKEMTERADRLKAVLQRHSEPVLAVCWLFPYAAGFKHTDVIRVGTRFKQEHPNVQFWVGQPDKSPTPPENDLIPAVVDGIVIIGLGDTSAERVKAKAEECFPSWLEKAWGRPIIWYWFAAARGNKAGIVPRVELGTFRAYLEEARRYRLAGLVFDCYGKPQGQDRVPLDSRPELVEEIRQISHELGFDSGK